MFLFSSISNCKAYRLFCNSKLSMNLANFTVCQNESYLSSSVEMLEDTTETKDELSLTSLPENFQNKFPALFSICLKLATPIIKLPFDSSGANKEIPMKTDIIPSMNIVVLSASNTCFKDRGSRMLQCNMHEGRIHQKLKVTVMRVHTQITHLMGIS